MTITTMASMRVSARGLLERGEIVRVKDMDCSSHVQ